MMFHKNKKVEEKAKINSFTVHLLLFSLIILVIFHTIFASFTMLCFNIFMISD